MSASVIVPFLPVGGAWRKADERSLSLQTLSAAAVCTGEKTITASKRCFWVLPSFNGPGEVHW